MSDDLDGRVQLGKMNLVGGPEHQEGHSELYSISTGEPQQVWQQEVKRMNSFAKYSQGPLESESSLDPQREILILWDTG